MHKDVLTMTYNKRNSRQAFVGSLLDTSDLAILEIGALNTPTFGSQDYNVKFADWFSQDELIANYPNKENIIPVDFVIKEKNFGKNFDTRFDLIIANHVIEHIPDMISWLAELSNISNSNGRLFLSIPDRRYTFDRDRQETTLSEFLDFYIRRLEMPDFRQVFEHLYYHNKVDAKEVWDGNNPPLLPRRFEAKSSMKKALAMSKTYHSVHCNVFTKYSFEIAIDGINESGLGFWSIEKIQEPAKYSNEFHVLLKKES